MNSIENVIFEVSEALRAPVLILALLALAVALIELGAFLVELLRRRRRDYARLETASVEARAALERGDEAGAKSALRPVAWSTGMARALAFMVDQLGRAQAGDRLAKGLADFDFRSLRRLERTRLLVRAGPALGLMGTLIPLSPALEGLAEGNTEELSDNLRVAFSITVLGLLIGAIAFAISLVRDRLYGQDLSDLEFVAATLAPDSDLGGAAAAQPRPAARPAAAAPPPPAAAAAASGDKPPPPTDAKPLGTKLPPPGAAPVAPSGGSAASTDGPVAPPMPGTPSSGAGTSAPAPAGPAATVPPPPPPDSAGAGTPAPTPSASEGSPASAAPVPGTSAGSEGGSPPAPMPTGGQSAAADPPAHVSHSPAAPDAGAPGEAAAAPPPPPPPPAESDAPQAPPLPAPPIPEPPTEHLPPSGDRPTHAQNQSPRDGHSDPAPENQ